MTSWFKRKEREPDVQAALPNAWRYGAPTSDNSSGSSSVIVPAGNRSLTAAAKRSQPGDERDRRGNAADFGGWDAEAWGMYDQVGELRYTANAIAGRMGKAELYVKKDGVRVEDSEEDDEIAALITEQMVERAGLNVFVAGGCWLAGVPKSGQGTGEAKADAEWMICSTIEVKRANGKATIRGVEYDESAIYLSKIWDPHPAFWEQSDSPVRAALPVLREMVGLTQHTGAQIDSRLAGAGVYWIPNEILANPKVPEQPGGQQFSENPVLNAIMIAMLTPMQDRSSAASVVPLLMGAPGEQIKNIRFDSFATPFDEKTAELLEGGIKRLALCLDAPPELLLGNGDSNHWAAWLTRDEVVTAHVDPRLALLADGFTTAFYRPIKKQLENLSDEEVERYELAFDTSGLVQRPNRLADASTLHGVDAIGDKALRDAGGFEDEDAPSSDERAIKIAVQVATANPQLLDNMPEIVAAVKALLDGSPATGPAEVTSAREPGTLKPLAPANTSAAGPPPVAPIAEADAPPAAAPGGEAPMAAKKATLSEALAEMRANPDSAALLQALREAVPQ